MEKNKIAQKRIELYNKLVKHIREKWMWSKNTPWYRKMLSDLSGISQSSISRMMEEGYMLSYEYLITIENCVERVDRAFSELKIESNK